MRLSVSPMLLVILLWLPTSGGAQVFPAFTQTDDYSNLGFGVETTRGWEFTVSQRMQVVQLGFWDSGLDGLGAAHAVGIWSSDPTLLTSATVPAGTAAPLEGTFRWVSTTPVVLSPGQTYVIGAHWPLSGNDARVGGGVDTIFDVRVTPTNGRAVNSPGLTFPAFTGALELNANFRAGPVPNQPPVADAGADQSVYTGDITRLNGTAVSPDGAAIVACSWTVADAPAGSTYRLDDPDRAAALFAPYAAADYVLSLSVVDANANFSALDFVTVHAADNLAPVAISDASATSGPAPLTVCFDGSQSYDPEGDP